MSQAKIIFRDSLQTPFHLYGFYADPDKGVVDFRRMPAAAAIASSENVNRLHLNTSGGRVRFSTDSQSVVIQAEMEEITRFAHMPLSGTAGFDLYENHGGQSRYVKTFMPPVDIASGFESSFRFEERKMRDLTIYFPLYSNVTRLSIGLEEEAALTESASYRHDQPVLFYGSSITHGGCASRPGNAYPSIISRLLDTDIMNLGFSGSAKAEDAIARYISETEMSVFVYDYDHNAPDPAYLADTHARLFRTVRAKQADLPIILVSKPDFNSKNPDDIKRRNIILQTYMEAIEAGDQNIRFVDGEGLFNGIGRDSCTVDGCHPNDLGFMRMAVVIADRISEFL